MLDSTPASMAARKRRSARRRFGRSWLAVLLSLSLLAAACGGDDDDATDNTVAPGDDSTETTQAGGTETTEAPGTETTEAPQSDVNPDGVLRIAAGLVFPSGIHLDPTLSAVNADRPWMEMVFGTLFRWNEAGEIVPFMAESYEVVDPQTLNVTLRDGVTFPDGSVYDAETVKAGLERTLTQSSEVTVSSLATAFKDIADITIVDPLNLTITLNTPVVGELVAALTDREGVIVSPAQVASAPADIDSKPIGAGPFVVDEFIAEQRVVLSRNPEFFDPEMFQVSGIEWINVTDGATIVNGLLTDIFDVATAVPPVDAGRLDDRFTVESRPTDRSYIALLMCSGKAPLDDADVRRAVQVGIDRQAISDLVFDGLASPALGLWPEGHVNYNPEVEDIVTYDPELAEELLGGASVDLDVAIIAAVPGHDTIAQVIQSQLGDVGIDVTIVPTQDPVAEFITPELPGALMVPGSRTGVDKYDRVFTQGQSQALCGVGRPDVIDPLAPAAALPPGDPSAAELFQAAELVIAENAYLVPLVFQPNLVVYNSETLGGDALFTSSQSQPMIDTFYVRAG